MKTFTPRKKNLMPFYSRALILLNKYTLIEKIFIDNENLSNLIVKQQELGTEFKNDDPKVLELALMSSELINQKNTAVNIFLTTDTKLEPSTENAKEICDIMYEDCDIDFNKELTDEELDEYLTFITGVWDAFFLKYQKLLNIRQTLKKNHPAG